MGPIYNDDDNISYFDPFSFDDVNGFKTTFNIYDHVAKKYVSFDVMYQKILENRIYKQTLKTKNIDTFLKKKKKQKKLRKKFKKIKKYHQKRKCDPFKGESPTPPYILPPQPVLPKHLHNQNLRTIKNKKTGRKTTAIACTRCRQKKQKCDVKRPCSRCIKSGCGDKCCDPDLSTRKKQHYKLKFL